MELESNKQVTINNVLYYFRNLLDDSGSGLTINKIIRNYYSYSGEFCAGFRKKLWELIDDSQDVYVLGIEILLDGIHISVKPMELTRGIKLTNHWK